MAATDRTRRSTHRWRTAEKSHEAAFRFRRHPTKMRRSPVGLWTAASTRTCYSLSAKRPGSNAL